MQLTEQDHELGLVITTCTCCGHVYKTHRAANSCQFGWNPGYGCIKCQGVPPKPNQRGLDK